MLAAMLSNPRSRAADKIVCEFAYSPSLPSDRITSATYHLVHHPKCSTRHRQIHPPRLERIGLDKIQSVLGVTVSPDWTVVF